MYKHKRGIILEKLPHILHSGVLPKIYFISKVNMKRGYHSERVNKN